MQTKEEIRRDMLALRRRMPSAVLAERSGLICGRVMRMELFKRAEGILTYVPLPGEVSTLPLIRGTWQAGKTVAVPRVTEEGLVFSAIRSLDELEEGAFHVMEPRESAPADFAGFPVILPGLAFDGRGNRIGYGRGYYDRYLAARPGHPLVALSFDFAVLQEVPSTSEDVRADLIVTESGVLCCHLDRIHF